MVNWDKQLERVEELAGGNRVKDGDTINLDSIKDVREREDTFTTEEGKTIKTLRFVYVTLDDMEIVVPSSLHAKIAKLKKEYGERLHEIKVKVEGKGIKTRYDALPVL